MRMPISSFSRVLSNGRVSKSLLLASALVMTLAPTASWACACGCSVFDVGTSTLLPGGPGGTIYFQYAFLDQTQNWDGTGRAPASGNTDKEIRSNFFDVGGQYMFNDSWGVMGEVPLTNRYFKTDVGGGDIQSFSHASFGDVKLMGVYSGFSEDMSTGVIFGFKLPTGDHSYANFDPDVEIGTGSTDVMLGGYHTGSFTVDQSFSYFLQGVWQHEIAIEDQYRPGFELEAAAGVSYNNAKFGDFHVTPILQLLVSDRGRDGGAAGDPADTGYQRLLISPGIELDRGGVWKVYADAEMPIYQHINGNQLIAPVAVKFIASYSF
jgi:hypothetical protein